MAVRGLADDFDELGQCEPQQLVIEVAALLAFAVGESLGGRLAQVPQPDSVFRLHREAGRWR